MHGPGNLRRAISLLLLLAGTPVAHGQRPVQGLVLDPELQPLTGADVSFHQGSGPGLPWLRELTSDATPAAGHTDGRGRYRILPSTGPGCLLVVHPTGLGALVIDAAPGSPDRVLARPLGEVRIEDAETPFTSHVAAILPGGGHQYLGRWHDTKLRLPAGAYHLLIQQGARTAEQVCRVEEGRPVTLPRLLPGQPIALPAGFDGKVFLDGWPHLQRPRPLFLPATAGPRVLRVVRPVARDEVIDRVWIAADDKRVELPPLPARWAQVQVFGPDGRPLAGARIYTVEPSAQGPTVRARSVTDRHGHGRRALTDGARVLVHARDMGLSLVDSETLQKRPEIHLARGCDIDVRVTGGEPSAAGITVELQHASDRWLVITARTGQRGMARFHSLPSGNATLRLRSSEYLPAETTIELPTANASTLPALPGERLTGRVLLAGGDAAFGAQVRLRDTTGQLLDVRDQVADRRGGFAFGGLPNDALFTLSAELQRDGRTWSAQVRGVQPGDGAAVLELRLEDPLPPHRRKH